MNMIKAIVMVVTFGMASLALAEGGADRTFARMEAARASSMQAYQVAQEKSRGSCYRPKPKAPRPRELLSLAYRNVITPESELCQLSGYCLPQSLCFGESLRGLGELN